MGVSSDGSSSMASQVEMDIESLRVLDWGNQWDNNLDLHWDIILVQYL